VRIYLTQYIYQSVLESQLPHKIVNLAFTITKQNIESTFLGGVDFLKLTNEHIVSDDSVRREYRLWGCEAPPPVAWLLMSEVQGYLAHKKHPPL